MPVSSEGKVPTTDGYNKFVSNNRLFISIKQS